MADRSLIKRCTGVVLALVTSCTNESRRTSRPLLKPHRGAILAEKLDPGYVRVSSADLATDEVGHRWPPSDGWHAFGFVVDAAASNTVVLRLVDSKAGQSIANCSLTLPPSKSAIVVSTRLDGPASSPTLIVNIHDGTLADAPLLAEFRHAVSPELVDASQLDYHDRWSDGRAFRESWSHQPLAAFSWNGPGSASLASDRDDGAGRGMVRIAKGMNEDLLRLKTSEWPKATLELQAAAAW